jgi:hypothetical protein
MRKVLRITRTPTATLVEWVHNGKATRAPLRITGQVPPVWWESLAAAGYVVEERRQAKAA